MSAASVKLSVVLSTGEHIDFEASHQGESYASAGGLLDSVTKKAQELIKTIRNEKEAAK